MQKPGSSCNWLIAQNETLLGRLSSSAQTNVRIVPQGPILLDVSNTRENAYTVGFDQWVCMNWNIWTRYRIICGANSTNAAGAWFSAWGYIRWHASHETVSDSTYWGSPWACHSVHAETSTTKTFRYLKLKELSTRLVPFFVSIVLLCPKISSVGWWYRCHSCAATIRSEYCQTRYLQLFYHCWLFPSVQPQRALSLVQALLCTFIRAIY